MIRGALQGGSPMGFLWSRGRGGDTGFGKTALMKRTVREINQDWGHGVQIATGMKEERIVPVVAAFSELNTLSRTGMYPVLFNAVLSTASGPDAPLLQARQKISEIVGDDGPAAIRDALTQARIRVAPTSSALRPRISWTSSRRATRNCRNFSARSRTRARYATGSSTSTSP